MLSVTGWGVRSAAFLLPLSLVGQALAQDPAPPPKGLMSQAPATAGSTNVAQEGFQAVAKPPAPEEAKDNTTLKLTAGGFLSQGNSRTIAATGSADFFIRRSRSAFSVLAAANYGRSAPANGLPYETTVENYQARLRYDYFFVNSLAGFVSASARRDEFQGLNLRLNLDPGLAYYFIDEKSERFWGELGYDLQYDLRTQEIIDLGEDESEVRHNVRAFVGYDNQLSDSVKFGGGLEYLQNVTAAENARLNFDAGITSQLNQDFSIASTVSLKYDNNPLPEVEKTDLIVALNLVYTMN
jgi:putative salt-induced outer membrane protein